MNSDPTSRVHQSALVLGLIALSWTGAMAVHEFGHVVAAWVTGGSVVRVVLHPLAMSRTDVDPNMAPGLVAWAGPIIGVMLPLLVAAAVRLIRATWGYTLWFFAGSCMLINGVYIGVGSFDGFGDADVMLRTGSARWALFVFGLLAASAGLYLWHRVDPRLGFGAAPERVRPVHAWASLAGAVVVTSGLAFFGDAG